MIWLAKVKGVGMFRQLKAKLKKSKNAKKIEADKQRLLALYEEYKYVWE